MSYLNLTDIPQFNKVKREQKNKLFITIGFVVFLFWKESCVSQPRRFPVSVFPCLSFCTCLGLNRWRPCVGNCIRGTVFGVARCWVLCQTIFVRRSCLRC